MTPLDSEGRRLFAIAVGWSNGPGRRDSLDTLAAQLAAAGCTVTRQMVSALLNATRTPSLATAAAVERAFGVRCIAWTMPVGQPAVDRKSPVRIGPDSTDRENAEHA